VSDPDAIVIGAGPNGLVAACVLARAGWSVRLLEANDEPGGAVRSRALTLPGFVHDMGAAFFPFGEASPALRDLDLPGAGLVWKRGALESAHVAPDGTCASISRNLDEHLTCFGGLEEDGAAFRDLAAWAHETRDQLLAMLLGPLPPFGAALRYGPLNLLRLAEVGLSTGRGHAVRNFRSEAARRVLPGLALHTDLGPDDPLGAAVGFMLGALAASSGFAVPEGGTSSITRALVDRFEEAGGIVQTGVHADRVIVKDGEAVALATSAGEMRARRAIVGDVAAPSLYLRMLDEAVVPARVVRAMRRFDFGFGTFKVDWALDGPVPWIHPDAARAAVVHTGDDLDDLARFVAEARSGILPARPYLVIGQQSLLDPSRAPAGKHTLWCYSRVPPRLEEGWTAARQRYADEIEARIESMAPGFRARVLARRVTAPPDLEAQNENLLEGNLGGGSARIENQLFLRPIFPYFRYRTPIRRLYLGSSYTHPGAGVHGACGHNAAAAALRDWG
jgi:phytoene dehydrogenase-like protein